MAATMDDDEATNGVHRRDSQRFDRPLREEDAAPAPQAEPGITIPQSVVKMIGQWLLGPLIGVGGILGVQQMQAQPQQQAAQATEQSKDDIKEQATMKAAVSTLVGDVAAMKNEVAALKTSMATVATILDERLPKRRSTTGR